jgi:hypothetical protein
MDEYQRLMTGKTVEEVMAWAGERNNAAVQSGEAAATAQPEVSTSATMSLQSEYGDILLAIERAWEDAQRRQGPTKVDTNTVTDATQGEDSMS